MKRIEKLLDMSIDDLIKLDARTLLEEDNPSWLQDYIKTNFKVPVMII
jgi:hypothetical protein